LRFVEAVVPPEDLMAMDFAREIASKSPVAFGLAKHALNTIEEMSLRDDYRFEQYMTTELSHYEDAAEVMQAFLDKRDPGFKG